MAGFVGLVPYLILFIILSLSPVVPHLHGSQMICKDNTNSLIFELDDMKLKVAQLESILEESTQSLNTKIHNLEEEKTDSTYAVERVNALEEEVRLLWDASRKNNFDIHTLESKVQDTEIKLKVVTSRIEQMGSIVTEQWIQIQQLDQALQITEMRILRAQRKTGSRCTFMKLQRFVKREMEKNEFTAPVANQEVVFFVASAIVTFPLLSVWLLLLSHFS